MGSLGNEVARKKAMWLYPKASGAIPSERWGHSACYSHGVVYIFGGCCGGLHFSDVLMLNLETMTWSTLATSGHGPGPRDSHSAILVGHRMIVFGGTNGSKKVNDLHILDLCSREWTRPDCKGTPPSPRESHTTTLVGDKKLVIFGGSGEGEGNYLNDLHVLDLETMTWKSPLVKGDIPIPRDSHSTVAIENKLFVYGGDCGDRYHGGVDMFDMGTLSWSRLEVREPSPGVRAGHAAVHVGTKLYVLGGVGDKHYYDDVWSFDVTTCSWTQLDICGQQPQGRFSHTAIVTNSDIAIYGGCGEDERPLNELLVLQLGAEHPSGRKNISLCKTFGNHCNLERERFTRGSEYNPKKLFSASNSELVRKESCQPIPDFKHSPQFGSDRVQPKRRKTIKTKAWEIESEQEEHSLSLSQHSSPSQSDQEQPPFHKASDSVTASPTLPFLKKHISGQTNNKFMHNQPDHVARKTPLDLHFSGKHQSQPKPEQNSSELGLVQNLIGADIRGKIDGAFDSGFLMTATVNGKIFRGVLFSPGPGVAPPDGAYLAQTPAWPMSHVTLAHPYPNSSNVGFISRLAEQPMPECPMSRVIRGTQSLDRDAKLRNDLHGLVLTLGPGSDRS